MLLAPGIAAAPIGALIGALTGALAACTTPVVSSRPDPGPPKSTPGTVLVETPDKKVKLDPREDELEWSELSVDVVARGLTALDLVAVQVLLKAAIDAPAGRPRPCAFSNEWLARGPQYFQGEWDHRFGRARPIGPERICGVRLDRLVSNQLAACAAELVRAGECARLHSGG